MASYNNNADYNDPYSANPLPGARTTGTEQYGARVGEDFSTPPYYNQSADYNSYGGAATPVSGDDATAASSLSVPSSTPKGGLGAEKPHPDDLDGVNTLGDIGGTARERPGRAGLHQPTSSFVAMGPPPRSTGILRMWRKDERGKQWFKGGGARSTGRLVCCCLTITVLMVISIILTVLMYIRPPSITLNDVTFSPQSVQLDTTNHEFQVAVNLSISVENPNWFDANFKRIEAEVRYKNGQFGGGSLNNVNFKGFYRSTFDFPFYLNYTAAADPNGAMIQALAASCGVTGTSRQITVDYSLKLWLSIFSATIKPTLDSSATLNCPLDGDQINSILG